MHENITSHLCTLVLILHTSCRVSTWIYIPVRIKYGYCCQKQHTVPFLSFKPSYPSSCDIPRAKPSLNYIKIANNENIRLIRVIGDVTKGEPLWWNILHNTQKRRGWGHVAHMGRVTTLGLNATKYSNKLRYISIHWRSILNENDNCRGDWN